MPRLTDTSAEAEQVLRQVYRCMPMDRKWRQMGEVYHTGQLLHRAGLQGATPRTMTGNNENLLVIQEVIAVLDQLGIAYALGGSWASSLLGKIRFTHDADLTVEPFPGREAEFCSRFGPEYYVSLPAVQQAVRQRGSCNIIHTLSGFKVDLFIRKDRPFEQALMARRFAFALPGQGQSIQCVSPEDLILLKLQCAFLPSPLGGEGVGVRGMRSPLTPTPSPPQGRGEQAVIDQQLLDVRGVLDVQGDRLDWAYLDRWATELGVQDQLTRAREEAAS